MAFETHLIAISWVNGEYTVVSKTTADVDIDALKRSGLMHDVSQGVGYVDEAAIIQKDHFVNYLLPKTNSQRKAAAKWHASLPPMTTFIMVHRAEWDSGLDG